MHVCPFSLGILKTGNLSSDLKLLGAYKHFCECGVWILLLYLESKGSSFNHGELE